MIDHVKLAELREECTDPDNIVGNPAVHAVDKDALIRLLVKALDGAVNSMVLERTIDCVRFDRAHQAIEAARKAGYL